MLKVWADVAWSDYCKFFEQNQKKQIKMVHELIKDIERNGEDKGRGQPEPLKYELTGYWSRRIDLANRLVYTDTVPRKPPSWSTEATTSGACSTLSTPTARKSPTATTTADR